MIRRAIALLGLALAACSEPKDPKAPPAAPPVEITILYTSDEHGWLLAHADKGEVLGGAAEMLAQWIAREGHCPGPPAPQAGSATPRLAQPCPDPKTLALSGGDNYTGPAISSYFGGESMAEAFARMGYAASAFGNHELDFGRAQFTKNRGTSGITYLAANLHAPGSLPEMALPPYAIFERRGLKIGVVGLATDTTLHAAMAARFEGITFEAEEPSLNRAVSDAWAAGADAVVAVVHECPDVLLPILRRHPEWKLSFVGAGHCHKKIEERVGATPVISVGWRLDRYARVRVTFDPRRPRGERVLAVEPSFVEMARAEGSAAPPADPEIARLAAGWKEKVDAALGEEIGFAGSDLDRLSPELGRWVTRAWRAELGTDVGIVNRHGLRQSLPRGPITKASVWSVLPFDNKIVLLHMKGAALARTLDEADIEAGDAARSSGGWTLGGAPIDPDRVYSVATIDFLYYGDHLGLKSALDAKDIGLDWREPVIAWTKKKRSTKDRPIEVELR